MFKAGAHFGYSKSRRHPSVEPYIFGMKDTVEIFDLEKTGDLLKKAEDFTEELAANRKTLLFVSGKEECADIVRRGALSIEQPYVAGRWLGGTLTNFGEIKKRIDRLAELVSLRESGELERKYTKHERLMIQRDIERLENNFAGLASMQKLPDAVFAVDPKHEHTAVKEANMLRIPVVALLNSDCDMGVIDHPIVGNDAAVSSISFFVGKIVEAYQRGLARQKAPEAQQQ